MKEIKLLIDNDVTAISITTINPQINNAWIGTAAFEAKDKMIISIFDDGKIREESEVQKNEM